MPASSQVTVKASGLNINPNYLDLPNGSLIVANDVIIRRENVIESRRGMSDWSSDIGGITNQIIEYKNRILAQYGSTLKYDTGLVDSSGKEIFNAFSGSYSSASEYRMRFIEANKNLYLTTSDGIKKISAATADDFTTASGFITNAGAVKAIDFTANLNITQGQITGFLSNDSAVAYRTVLGYKDANNNLVLGSPSSRVLVYNYQYNNTVLDLNKLLSILDIYGTKGTASSTNTLITSTNWYSAFSLNINPVVSTLKNNIIGLAKQLDSNLLFANTTGTAPLTISSIAMDSAGTVTVSFSSGTVSNYISVGDYINIQNLTAPVVKSITATATVGPATTTTITSTGHGLTTGNTVIISGITSTPSINGNQVVTVVDSDHFTIPVTTTTITSGTGSMQYFDLTKFNSQYQVTSVGSSTLQFIYTPSASTTTTTTGSTTTTTTATITAIPTTPVNTTTTINGYNYTNITITGDDSFPTSLNDTTISIPSTAGQNATIQDTLERIVTRLRAELPAVISTSLLTQYLIPTVYSFTTAANVFLKATLPSNIDSNYFVQVYRSNVFSAFNQSQGDTLVLGETVIPDDELHLVLEYFPNATDTANGYITYLDQYPDSLAQTNTPLYTNPSTGDGILQSNDQPPYAKDINFFKNVAFYANTKTRHTIPNFQLLGVDNIANGDTITIGNSTTNNTYTFINGAKESTTFTFTSANAAALKTAIQNKYFTINSVNDTNQYYVWYRYDATGTDPAISGKIGIVVDVLTGDDQTVVANRTAEILNGYIYQYTATSSTNTFTVVNIDQGIATNATIGNISSGNLALVINTNGAGEDAANGQVLISRTASAAINIDLTARSLIRVINYKNNNSPIYAYYTSSDNTSPGQIDLEAKVLGDDPFYIIASGATYNSNVNGIGNSFNPDISPIHVTTGSIVNSSTSGYVTFTATAHGLVNGNQVIITHTDSTPVVNGVYNVANVTTNTFDVLHSSLSGNGTTFSWELTSDSVASTNDSKPNRVFYSKYNQPEAVPLLNYFDIGPEDKEILRIFPLRNSLFVFKEDGLYRISGQTAPFTVQLFDTSCILTAPDTIDIADNTIYGWTSKGITNITESGTNEISKPVDIQLFRLASSSYPNFKYLTWGIGYNSDNSYTVYTNSLTSDTVATIGFRYCTLTSTWTNIVRSQTCGLVRTTDDLLYLGDGTQNIINQERKTYTRTDYADRDFPVDLTGNMLTQNGKVIQLDNVDSIGLGDAFVQTQYVTIYTFNALLQKLDIDPGIHDSNYYSTLLMVAGDNLRAKLVALAQKLDADSGTATKTYYQHIADQTTNTVTSNAIGNPTTLTTSTAHKLVDGRIITITGTQSPPSINPITDGNYTVSNTGTWGSSTTFTIPITVTTASGSGLSISTAPNSNGFLDIKACYNAIIGLLNADTGVNFSDYKTVTTSTDFESVVNSVNTINKKITLNITNPFIVGPIQVYKAIPNQVLYSPLTFGDPLSLKQIFQATAMFNNTAFTRATMSFSSDLKPEFFSVPFNNLGNGIFGSYSDPGFGFGYFGGAGNSKPFRTYIPLQTQRCRYINIKYEHQTAREQVELFGVTLTGNLGISNRAYR
jgi:hypothetical protein